MALPIGKCRTRTLFDFGQLVLAVYLISILFLVVVLGLVLRLCGVNSGTYSLILRTRPCWCRRDSTETMLPQSMKKLERLGCNKKAVGLLVPTGFAFNMAGTAVYMTIGILMFC